MDLLLFIVSGISVTVLSFDQASPPPLHARHHSLRQHARGTWPAAASAVFGVRLVLVVTHAGLLCHLPTMAVVWMCVSLTL